VLSGHIVRVVMSEKYIPTMFGFHQHGQVTSVWVATTVRSSVIASVRRCSLSHNYSLKFALMYTIILLATQLDT
jgi:hypothetical protein